MGLPDRNESPADYSEATGRAGSETFDAFAVDLAEGRDARYDPAGIDEALLADDVKIGCTQGMLLCLDRDHRVAYVLGEVFELPGEWAAYILVITPAAYRKRLSRARAHIQPFKESHCGPVDAANPCRSARLIGRAIASGRVLPGQLLFAGVPEQHRPTVRAGVEEVDRLHATAVIFRSHPHYRTPRTVAAKITELLDGDRLTMLSRRERDGE